MKPSSRIIMLRKHLTFAQSHEAGLSDYRARQHWAARDVVNAISLAPSDVRTGKIRDIHIGRALCFGSWILVSRKTFISLMLK